MITYRDVVREAPVPELLRRLEARAGAGDALSCLVEGGELEQGLADATGPVRDGWGPTERLLREMVCAAGRAFCSERCGDSPAPALRRMRRALQRLCDRALPPVVRIHAPEGYVHYALDPGAYAASAARYATEAGAARAARAVVVGVRSIGTSLSATVAAALGSERSLTVRPRGRTGERHVAAEPALQSTLREWLREGGDALVVDEGPGATGETFWCVAQWLESLGVSPSRVVLFPSHTGGMALATEERRQWFARARKFAPPLEDERVARLADRLGATEVENLSGGRWREVVPGAASAPACVNFERQKFRVRDPRGRVLLIRYAGLGRWGAEAVERAVRLGEAGAGPEVVAVHGGYVISAWMDGHLLGGRTAASRGFAAALSHYLQGRSGLFPTGRPVEIGALRAMLLENAREALGEDPPGLGAAVERLERLPVREAHVADARLVAREWLCTADGFRKVDGFDHGDGLRFPGPTDAAWDLAGAAVEFGLSHTETDALIGACARASGESASELAAAVTAYRAPYAACGLGDASLSAREAASAHDRRRLDDEARRYREMLARELGRGLQPVNRRTP